MTKATDAKIARILTLLSDTAMGSRELADAIFCTQCRANTLLRILRDAKCVYRSGSRKGDPGLIPVYRVGDLPDAPLTSSPP